MLSLSALAVTGCRGGGGAETLSIGLALGANIKTSSMASVVNGVELAMDELNRRAAAEGASVRFALTTAPNTLTSAVQIATALREDHRVIGVVGHTDSGGMLEAASVYSDDEHEGEHALVAVSPTATSIALTNRSPWLFRVCPSDAAASQAAARYAADSLGARRAAVLYRNDAYGKGWTRAFTEAFQDAGGAVVERDPHVSGMSDWAAYAGYIRKLRPDVVLFPGSPQDAVVFLRALRAVGAGGAFLGGDAISELEAQSDEFRGVYYTAFFLPGEARTTEARAFMEAYRQKYGGAPDQRAALSYDAALVIGTAALASDPTRAGLRRRVRDYIAGVGSAHPAIAGVTGPIAFDPRHEVLGKPVVIARVGGRPAGEAR
jgi:branched-chain amino acid transport system substrate-binding protein